MPFIQVFYSRAYAPSWQVDSFGNELWKFCYSLPDKISRALNKELSRYRLSGEMQPTDIRIAFAEHGMFDINPADVHFRIVFDGFFNQQQQAMFRDLLATKILENIGNLIISPKTIVLELYANGWCGATISDGFIRTWN